MSRIAVFYHGVFSLGRGVQVDKWASAVLCAQMASLEACKLLESSELFTIGLNGNAEDKRMLPESIRSRNPTMLAHGLDCRSENPTLVHLREWAKSNPGWVVLYFHAKGATHPNDARSTAWRNCMMHHLVTNWRTCVSDLERHDAVGCHWIRGLDDTQHYFAGNFWWATSDFLSTLPSMYERLAIKLYGIKAAKSRYEAEVWIGNGPRLPKVKDYHPQLH